MNEQISNPLPSVAHFTKSKLGVTGLTVTVDVWRWNGSAWTQVVTAAAATEVGRGAYSYQLASGSVTVDGLYLFIFITAGDVDQKEIICGWSAGKAGVENLDAAVSTRSSHSAADVWASATRTLTSFGTLAADVWAYATRTLTSYGTVAADVWDRLTSALTTSGSIGELAVSALGRIGTATISVVGPVPGDGGGLSLITGDSYLNADSRAVSWTEDEDATAWPSLSGATVTWKVYADDGSTFYSKALTVTSSVAPQAVRLELTSAQSANLTAGVRRYDIEAVIGAERYTLVQGRLTTSID